MANLLDRITTHPENCHGKPCIRNMRWPVEVILDMLGSGMSIDEILEDHKELEKEDILACLNFARLSVNSNFLKDIQNLRKEIELGWNGPDSSMTMDEIIESKKIC